MKFTRAKKGHRTMFLNVAVAFAFRTANRAFLLLLCFVTITLNIGAVGRLKTSQRTSTPASHASEVQRTIGITRPQSRVDATSTPLHVPDEPPDSKSLARLQSGSGDATQQLQQPIGRFLGDIAEDTRTCTSPERSRSFPMQQCDDIDAPLVARSQTSPTVCGSCRQNDFSRFLDGLSRRIQELKQDECSRFVAYGVAFGDQHKQLLMRTARRPGQRKATAEANQRKLRVHNKCFFVFVLAGKDEKLERDGRETKEFYDELLSFKETSAGGLEILIPIPKHVLPYQDMRRNAKLFKFNSHILFPWAERVFWQDTKFRRFMFGQVLPTNYFAYFDKFVNHNGVCVAFMGMPTHKSTMGVARHVTLTESDFLAHCNTVVEASARRDVTDSIDTLRRQCALYNEIDNLQQNELSLSDGLVDSAFIAFDHRSDRCRQFIAQLSCTWLDELHCYSDRDQISLPMVLQSLGLSQSDPNPSSRNHHKVLIEGSRGDNELIEPGFSGRPVVQIIESRCHWYYGKLDNCKAG